MNKNSCNHKWEYTHTIVTIEYKENYSCPRCRCGETLRKTVRTDVF